VNKVKRRADTNIEDSDDGGSVETAICPSAPGTVMRSGSPRRPYNRSVGSSIGFMLFSSPRTLF
jgi:hypothetical protein